MRQRRQTAWERRFGSVFSSQIFSSREILVLVPFSCSRLIFLNSGGNRPFAVEPPPRAPYHFDEPQCRDSDSPDTKIGIGRRRLRLVRHRCERGRSVLGKLLL